VIRVAIADDQPLFREGLRAVLSLDAGLEIVGDAPNGEALLELCARTRPNVVLMDLQMPVMNGVVATRQLKVKHPDCAVLVLTTFDDDEWVFEALRAGAVGYLLKDASAERLREAVRGAASGASFLHPAVATKVLARLRSGGAPPASDPFTDRERDVVKLLVRGASNKEIASALFVSEGTVKNHVTNILEKLEVDDRTQAALKAREFGFG
jgi:DNA-binding NarL/FixJ family response regulator